MIVLPTPVEARALRYSALDGVAAHDARLGQPEPRQHGPDVGHARLQARIPSRLYSDATAVSMSQSTFADAQGS